MVYVKHGVEAVGRRKFLIMRPDPILDVGVPIDIGNVNP
jgi:hypothetical protein